MIVGVLSLSNGTGLNYPFPPVILNLSKLCDEVVVGLDPNFPEDFKVVEHLIKNVTPNVGIFTSVWDRGNIKGGAEIARQMDILCCLAGDAALKAAWVVVPQADELFLDDDFDMLRTFMERAPPDVSGFSMERLYFWENLDKVRKDWNAELVRIFRPGYFSFLAEGTDKAGMYSGPIKEGKIVALTYKLYHYSRIGSKSDISKRIRNLDGFFHSPETLVPENDLPDYDFATRAYDNFSTVETPPAVDGVIDNYAGKHPMGVKEWFGE